jgi:hypothetical protein
MLGEVTLHNFHRLEVVPKGRIIDLFVEELLQRDISRNCLLATHLQFLVSSQDIVNFEKLLLESLHSKIETMISEFPLISEIPPPRHIFE